tara:strand:- start:243 stop:431 length:189 start_codon:yes stop_codon:yes gene_type:complete
MNPLRVFEYIFKGGACYALIRYNDDMIMQAAGLFLLIGFTFRAVDEIRKDYIMNKKGVENVR